MPEIAVKSAELHERRVGCPLYSILHSKDGHGAGPRSQFQMEISVPMGSCGSTVTMITLKPGSGDRVGLNCLRSTVYVVHRQFLLYKSYTTGTRLASRPLRSYTAIQRYTPYRYTSTRMQHRPLSAPVRFGVVCMAEGGGRAFTERSDLWAAQIIDFWLPVVLRR